MDQFYKEDKVAQTNPALSTGWIENLAMEEINMDESGVIHFNEHIGPMVYLEESSVRYMDDLREKFEFFVNRFNEFRGQIGHTGLIKLFKISNTVNDFMLYRNSLRLVVARKATDLISIGMLTNSGGPFAARLGTSDDNRGVPHELKAHVGPFNTISWRFKGEVVDTDALVRHYLTEFIQHSAR